MMLRKKPLYDKKPRVPKNYLQLFGDQAWSYYSKLTDKLSNGLVILISASLSFMIFFFFKWMNRGRVNIITTGDNIINMMILFFVFDFMIDLWIKFNGEEPMGWGGM